MNGVVIVAAGSGSRMKTNKSKQFIKLNEKEIIAHTIEKFYKHSNIHDIVVVIRREDLDFVKSNILDKYGFKGIKIAFGGAERQDSGYNGLKLLDGSCEIAMVHDGARPFVTKEIIDKSIEQAKKHKAVVVGVPVKDTIKIVNEQKDVIDTPERHKLWSIQTPQTFDYNTLLKAHENASKEGFCGTDDSMLVERIGYKVKIVEGDYTNIKITTPEDINIGMQILKIEG